jgi:hypothetical protein
MVEKIAQDIAEFRREYQKIFFSFDDEYDPDKLLLCSLSNPLDSNLGGSGIN